MEAIVATLTEQRDLKIEIVGTLSLTAAEDLKEQFDELARRGLASVEVDCARAEIITSVGLSALAVVWERAGEAGAPIRFTNVSKDLLKLFEVTGLRQIFVPDSRTPGAPRPGGRR
jgi:anti-anti-sigma factor